MSHPFICACAVAIAALLASPAAAADVQAGKKKAASCAVCHGIDGLHKVPDAPNLAGNSAEYLTKQLKAFQTGARQHEQMSIIAKGLNDQDVRNLADWYSGLKVTVDIPR